MTPTTATHDPAPAFWPHDDDDMWLVEIQSQTPGVYLNQSAVALAVVQHVMQQVVAQLRDRQRHPVITAHDHRRSSGKVLNLQWVHRNRLVVETGHE